MELLTEIDSRYYPQHFEFLIDPLRREYLIIEQRLDAVELTQVRDQFRTDEDILELLVKLVCALDVLWQRRVIHRDIKPANILITPEGEPRIIDLGIARFLEDTSLTATMAARGPATPIYATPEQLRNRKSMINVRTDFFLLGLLVLELLHGFHPFDPQHVGNQATITDNILAGRYVSPPQGHDPRLVTFIERVLEPKPFKRFRTVGELMACLDMDGSEC